MLRTLTTCFPVLALAVLAPAQNLVVNGDFEGPTLAPWTIVNFAINPSAEDFNTSGTGESRCYATTPGLPAQLDDPHALEQIVTLVAGVTYEVRYDVEATYRSAGGAPLDVMLQVGGEFGLPAVLPESLSLLQPEFRLHRAGLFTAMASGDVMVRMNFRHAGIAIVDISPRVRIDNIDIRPSRQPFIGQFEKQRRISSGNTLTMQGAANTQYWLFMSLQLADPPIPVPPITGEVRIGPLALRSLRTGVFDGLGKTTMVFLIPNIPSLRGVPVYWQAVQFDAARGIADLGWETTQGFR